MSFSISVTRFKFGDVAFLLYRNFPDQYVKERRDPLQLETKNVMAWIQSYPFVLSANLHGGSLVANYPYDDLPGGKRGSDYSMSPDDDVFKTLALTYSENHATMSLPKPPCKNEPEEIFKRGWKVVLHIPLI